MLLTIHCLLGALSLSVETARADSYANNQSPTVVDSPEVAANFPDVDGVELLSPTFDNPAGVPPTFGNGTSGPTPQTTLGVSRIPQIHARMTNIDSEAFVKGLSNRTDWIQYH